MTAPLIEALTPPHSEKILERNRVGRLAFTTQGRVNILPMHYRYDGGWIYGRTQPGGKLLLILRNRRVAFEVDEHEDVFEWRSVVAHGTFYIIERSDEKVYKRAVELMREVMPSTMTTADPTPYRTYFFRINVAELTGRAATPSGGQMTGASDEEPTESAVAETDVALRKTVQNAVEGVGHADTDKVTVDVLEGIVVLGGVVSTHQEAAEIERAVAGVRDARVIVLQLEVNSPDEAAPDPVDLARAVHQVLARDRSGSDVDDVRVAIENGWVRAEGTVSSAERHAELVRDLRTIRGARGFLDRIRVA